MREMTVSPILLSDQVRFDTPATTRYDQPLLFKNLDQLKNPSRTPFLLDEIRFRVLPGTTLHPAILALTRVRLDLGRLQLTAGKFIPISLLGPSLDSVVDSLTAADSSGASTSLYATPVYAVGLGYDGHSFTWRLPRPFYVPAGETVSPQFILSRDIVNTFSGQTTLNLGEFAISISYVGRVLPSDAPVPSYVFAPFSTAWIDSVRLGNTKSLAVRSIRSDLKNPHGETVFVQRMVGQFIYQSGTAGPTVGSSMGYGAVTAALGAANGATDTDLIGNDLVNSRLFKSNGRIIARDATPWAHLFPWSTRALDICGVLRRNEYYQIMSDIDLTGRHANDRLQLMASITGYRKVAYAGGYQEAG